MPTGSRPGNGVRAKEEILYLDAVVYPRHEQNFIFTNWPNDGSYFRNLKVSSLLVGNTLRRVPFVM